MTFPLLWHLCYFSNLRENSQVLATIAVHSTTFYISIAVFNSLLKKKLKKEMDMEKAGPSTRNPERQLPNKRKRYSSKFFCFRRKVPLTQFWTKKPRKAKKTCWWEKCMSFLVRCFIRRDNSVHRMLCLRSKRTKAQKLECDPPNVSICKGNYNLNSP